MPQAVDEAGNVWEVDAQGNAVALIRQANQAPANPQYQVDSATVGSQVAQTQAEAQRAQAQAAQAQAQTPYAPTVAAAEARKAEADARIAEANAASKASGRAEQTAATRETALKGFEDTRLLDEAIKEIEAAYAAGPGGTQGLRGIVDLFNTPENATFDTAGNSVRALVKGVLQFTGQENNTPRESEMNFGPYIPQASDYDQNIIAKLERLRRLRDSGYERAVRALGGIPDRDGNIVPIPEGEPLNAMTVNRIISGEGAGAADMFADDQSIPVNPLYQREYAPFLQEWGSNPDPDAYVAKRVELDRKYGYQSDPEAYRQWAIDTAQSLDRGGATIDPEIPNINAPLSGLDRLRNFGVSNPVGAGAVNFADMVGAGGVTALAPEQMQAIYDSQPVGSIAGQVVGAIAGTKGLGMAGGEVGKGVASSLRTMPRGGLGRRIAVSIKNPSNTNSFGRNLATDATYSGIYGGITEGDPLGNAAVGAAGSAGGQFLGKTLGGLVGGVKYSDAAARLGERGIPTTIGQKLGGGWRTAEEKTISLPLAGDAVRARYQEGIDAFQPAMFREASERAPTFVRGVGEEGVDDFKQRVVPAAYDKALGGRSFAVTPQFAQANTARMHAARNLPQNVSQDVEYALKWSLDPAYVQNGQLSGEALQDVYQNLQRKAAKLDKAESASGVDGANILRGALDDLGTMIDQQAPDVMPAFRDANSTYRNFKIVEDAVGRGVNQGGDVMPSQLGLAARTNSKKWGGNFASEDRPFFQLQRDAQDVLPNKLPNSGTADRLMQAGVGSAVLGGTGGAGYLAGGTEGAQTGTGLSLGLLALLAAGGTKGGQASLDRMLFGRLKPAQQFGGAIKRNAGLFGSAGVPLALTYGQ